MLVVLGGLADVERDLIRTRTAERRSRAKARGAPMGRPACLTVAQQQEVCQRRTDGETQADFALSYAVGISTIQWIKKHVA